MGKKKKRKSSRSSKSEPSDFSHNPFAKLAKKKPRKKAPPPPPPPEPEPEPPARELSPEEMFAEAMGDLGVEDIYRGKYGSDDAPAAGDGGAEVSTSGVAPELLDPAQRSGMELFEAEMQTSGVARIDGPQRVQAKPRVIEPERRSMSIEHRPEIADEASSVRLNKGERRLLQAAQRYERQRGTLAEISLRGLTLEPALERLAAFVEQHVRGASRYVRVVAGKGKQSQDAPVLKHAAADYFRGAGRVWVAEFAPIPNLDGDYGAFILRLRSAE